MVRYKSSPSDGNEGIIPRRMRSQWGEEEEKSNVGLLKIMSAFKN